MTKRWICPNCRTLLGIYRDHVLELRYKAMTYRVRDAESVETVCRRCGERVKAIR